MRRKKSAVSSFLLPSFSIPLLIFFLFIHSSIAFNEYSERQLIMADELPREEIALLYQRLKSGDSLMGGGRRKGSGRGKANANNGRTNGTTGKGGGGHQQEGSRRKIAPPFISAVLTSSSIAPTSRPSITPSSSSFSMSFYSTAGLNSNPKLASSSSSSQIWPPTFVQISRVTVIILIGLFFSLATTIGNALVMISICVDRKLQTISNYFLFSLAVADLTIGLISIPLMTLYTANENWSFGYALCQFWLCIDYLMCNASVLNLLLISFDRYFSVTRPLTYRPKRTTRKALFMIAATYTISLILWPPWIVLWPYLEGRFIIEESALCVVQFLALGNNRNWRNQLATVATAAAAFYIPVTLMMILYYKVYLETRRRQKELRKLQDGQQLFSPTKLAGTSALHSLMLPLAPLIRGLQSASDSAIPPASLQALTTPRNTPISIGPTPPPHQPQKSTGSGRINFMELVSNISTITPAPTPFKKKERFSLIKFCTGRAQTDVSSEDSVEDLAGMDETGGQTTSNLDSILADQTAVELAQSEMEKEKEEENEQKRAMKECSVPLSVVGNALELSRTSRISSVHTYNSIVIIEYPDNNNESSSKRPSVRLSSHAEVESLSARNSVERRLEPDREEKVSMNKERKEKDEINGSERQKVRLTKSCPTGPPQTAAIGQQHQQNGLMKKREIQMLREEQMRRSEKERRRNERKQESKAAKTLSAILFAFIITWTPYNVIVCLEAFYPNSVPASLFTLSYFLSYINSTINPLCYALCNARFRMTYMRILQCKWGRRNSGGHGGILSPFDGAFSLHHGQQTSGNSGRRAWLKGRHNRKAAK